MLYMCLIKVIDKIVLHIYKRKCLILKSIKQYDIIITFFYGFYSLWLFSRDPIDIINCLYGKFSLSHEYLQNH